MTLKEEKTRRNGFILVVVLCMIVMLAGILFGFNAGSRMTLRTIDNFGKSQKALNCAKAGLNVAISAIRNNADLHTSDVVLSTNSQENVFDIAGGVCSLTIVEESGKLNLNLLRSRNGSLNRTRIDQLLRVIDLVNRENFGRLRISYSVVSAILDWIDDDDEVTHLTFIKNESSGAESSYYQQLKPSYMCKNKPFDVTAELLLVKGVTMEVFDRLQDYVTVYGDGKININFAPKRVIESLSEEIDAALAQIIIDRRQQEPFESITELRQIPGMTDDIYYVLKKTATVNSSSQYYYVVSKGQVDRLSSTIITVLRKNEKTKRIETVLYEEY